MAVGDAARRQVEQNARNGQGPLDAGPSVAFSTTLAVIAFLLSYVTYSYMLSPGYKPPTAILQCETRTSMFGTSCLGDGCVKRKGKCVPASPAKGSTNGASKAVGQNQVHAAEGMFLQAGSPSISASKGHKYMRHRTIPNCLAAADHYEEAAAASSGAQVAAFHLKAGDALNCAMRIQGTGNIILLEGVLDTPSNKKFWGTHGPRALRLIRAAREAHPTLRHDAAAAAMEMDAFMYSSSSKGILRQALTGAGATFKALAEELVNTYTSFDGFVGHCYLGGFYAVAPWPLGDRKRGLAEFEAAFHAAPKTRRNGYYTCLLRYQHEDYAGAVSACETALNRAYCEGPTQPDYCEFLTTQVRKVLNLAKKKQQRAK